MGGTVIILITEITTDSIRRQNKDVLVNKMNILIIDIEVLIKGREIITIPTTIRNKDQRNSSLEAWLINHPLILILRGVSDQ